MARINRSDVIQKAVNDLALSQSGEKIPNETLDKVQLTYNLNKQFSNFCATINSSITGQVIVTLPTIPTGGRMFITSITGSFVKDAACDLATGTTLAITIKPISSGGVDKSIIMFPIITLTAQSNSIVLNFPYPIELTSATNIFYNATFTAGVLIRSCSVVGFTTSSN